MTSAHDVLDRSGLNVAVDRDFSTPRQESLRSGQSPIPSQVRLGAEDDHAEPKTDIFDYE